MKYYYSYNMKKPNTKILVKSVLQKYSKYKLSLSEKGVIESISAEVADELRRSFVIEPKSSWAKPVEKENADV
jgi:hypothetical protein